METGTKPNRFAGKARSAARARTRRTFSGLIRLNPTKSGLKNKFLGLHKVLRSSHPYSFVTPYHAEFRRRPVRGWPPPKNKNYQTNPFSIFSELYQSTTFIKSVSNRQKNEPISNPPLSRSLAPQFRHLFGARRSAFSVRCSPFQPSFQAIPTCAGVYLPDCPSHHSSANENSYSVASKGIVRLCCTGLSLC